MRRSSSTLRLSTIPFRSSNLATPPTPFSPQWPITPPSTAVNVISKEKLVTTTAWRRPPPEKALKWLWQCHMCNRIYQLGVTRRCLDDGHYFCAGTTSVRKDRRSGTLVRRHRACASEFDYSGWKHWGVWRRDVTCIIGPRKSRKDCWNTCDYPSECRWGRQYGIPTSSAVQSQDEKVDDGALQLAAVSLMDNLEKKSSRAGSNAADKGQEEEQIPNALLSEAPTDEEVVKTAQRRKRRSVGHSPSPLAVDQASRADFTGISDSDTRTGPRCNAQAVQSSEHLADAVPTAAKTNRGAPNTTENVDQRS